MNSSRRLVLLCLALGQQLRNAMSQEGIASSPAPPLDPVSDPLEYAVILDAGSAGSRVHVFSWSSDPDRVLDSLTEVCVKKIHPAISTFYDRKKKLKKYMHTLTTYAEQCIPPELWTSTKVSLLATAGLRKMRTLEQNWILAESLDILEGGAFSVADVKILSGEEEALYDWLAVVSAHRTEGQDIFAGGASRGVIDMGGESKQIAFTIKERARDVHNASGYPSDAFLRSHCSPRWLIQLPNQPEQIKLFSRSYNGFGLISSMNIAAQTYHDMWYDILAAESKCPRATCQYNDQETDIDDADSDFLSSKDLTNCRCDEPGIDAAALGGTISVEGTVDIVEIPPQPHIRYHNPCYAPGVFPPGDSHDLDYDLNGSGNFSACLDLVREIFSPRIPDIDIACIQVGCFNLSSYDCLSILFPTNYFNNLITYAILYSTLLYYAEYEVR
jgi:hypothetical protein